VAPVLALFALLAVTRFVVVRIILDKSLIAMAAALVLLLPTEHIKVLATLTAGLTADVPLSVLALIVTP
jgi:hypothetical protein